MIGSLKPPTSKMLHFPSAAYSDVAYLYTSVRWGYPESIVACDICEIWYHSRCKWHWEYWSSATTVCLFTQGDCGCELTNSPTGMAIQGLSHLPFWHRGVRISFLSFPLMNLVCQWLSFHSGIGPSRVSFPRRGRPPSITFFTFMSWYFNVGEKRAGWSSIQCLFNKWGRER